MKIEDVLALDVRQRQLIRRMAVGVIRAKEEGWEISGNCALRIVFYRLGPINALRQSLAHLRFRKRRPQYRVGDEIEATIEIFLQELARDYGCSAFTARISEKGATQKVQFLGKLVGRALGGSFSQ